MSTMWPQVSSFRDHLGKNHLEVTARTQKQMLCRIMTIPHN